MKLVIAEKPSVATSLAKVIGANNRGTGYYEGNGYLISWCIGHLVELSPPERYDKRYAKWRLEDLPILPDPFLYEVSANTKKQYQTLKSLMERKDVESLVCATDAGREGELIFRLVYNQCRCKKPFERLWISSMEDTAIRKGFENLRPGREYDSLYEAALCRERADWIVGMNATRLFSCLYKQPLSVGRVMTPTLAIVVMRDAQISAFRPEPFWTVQIYGGDLKSSSRHFSTKSDAESLLRRCNEAKKAVVLKTEIKDKLEKPPLLYDITSLQRDANRILGFTAQQTLDNAQALYEKKLVTYPRTDSRHLTEDMQDKLPALISEVAEKYGYTRDSICTEPAHPTSLFDSSKVSDHHAIIPTETMCESDINSLPSGEKAILQLVSVRLLCASAKDHLYSEAMVKIGCGAEEFTQKGKTVRVPGWKAIWQHFYPDKKKEEGTMSHIPAEGSSVNIDSAEVKEGKTSPPKHYTEDTLLSAMSTAGADEVPEDAERKGLGTPATRAATIEKLIQRGFIERRGEKKTKYLIATDIGNSLVTVMPEQIQSASMTAEWEQKLLAIEHGEYAASDFMDGIAGMIAGLVGDYEKVKGADAVMSGNRVVGTCPHCGAEVLERQKGWFCSNKTCRFVLWKDNSYFANIGKQPTSQIVEKLLKDKRVRLRDCKSQKTGKTYNADILLSVEPDGRPQFSMEFEHQKRGEK